MEDKRMSQYTPPNLAKSGWFQAGLEAGAAVKIKPAKPVRMAQECNPLVMVQINKQSWDETYEPEVGFERGTIFPALDLPFVGEGACRYE